MIRLVHIGLGPLGRRIVRYALERRDIRVVGAVDVAPDLAGRDLGTLCGAERIGIRVAPDIKSALGRRRADVALITTVSDIARIEPQVVEAARAGLNVVSTCEELTFPWRTAPARARRIDAAFRRHGVTCLSTGVNPGFLMDLLPSVLTGVCMRVRKVTVRRIQDASHRRLPFQRKIGAGLTLAEFRRRKADGSLRHVGLTESIHMIAHALGWELDRTTETVRPVIADRTIRSGDIVVRPGMAAGVEQIGRGFISRRAVILLHFSAALGEPKPADVVEIEGEPHIHSVIEGGVNGDIATCSIVLNAVRFVVGAGPGLKTMLDMPPVTCRA